MGTAYSDYVAKSTSEKLVLCWIEPFERLLIWTLDSGAIYTRTTSHFVIDILESTTSLVAASTTSLNSGEWHYNPETGTVYIRTSDDSNPNTKNIIATYRLFYANSPIDLPFDLSNGSDVHYEGALTGNSAITKQLDDEQIGVSLESNTSISFNNGSGLFDDIYDTLFFSNKRVRLYSFNENILLSEKKLLFDGLIQDKAFSTKKVSFKCKDFVFKLREPLTLNLFAVGDGTLADTYLYTPKRRIYGQVDQVQCVPIDNTLGGYALTGTLSGLSASVALTGSGTSFLSQCSPSDKLFIQLATEVVEATVESVNSDTSITLTDELESSFSGEAATNSPERPYRGKNRNFHIAGHKLRRPTTAVDVGIQPNRFTVIATTDLFPLDSISVDGETAIIKSISGLQITLTANLQAGTPANGVVVEKNPVSKAYFGGVELIVDRDFTVTNTTEAIINITSSAEANLARPKLIDGTVTFTNGSRSVTATGVDLVNEVRSRDWVRSSDISHTTFYEVLSVTEASLELRIVYAGATSSGTTAKKKRVNLIQDDSLILVNTIGYEDTTGAWVKTGSDAVKHMLELDIALTNTNAASFTQAGAEAPYTLSMVIPEKIGGAIPTINKVVTKINESIFGSLTNNSDWEMQYDVLSSHKPTDLVALNDDDIIGEISVKSSNKIVRKVNGNYRPFVDRFTGEDSFKLFQFTNADVDNFIGTRAEKEITIYLYDDSPAQEMIERYGLYNSLTQSVVSIKAKMNLMLKNLNDKLYIDLDRLYKRFSGKDRRKIGTISKISKDGSSVNVEMQDFGNAFNRVPSIALDTSLAYTSADADAKLVNGYSLDDNLDIPDITDDDYLGGGIIG